MAEREQLLSQFVEWSARHITGDEKGQAQIFLDRLFRAFGQKGRGRRRRQLRRLHLSAGRHTETLPPI